MKRSVMRRVVGLLLAVVGGASCADENADGVDLPLGQVRQALTEAERVLEFDGQIGGSGADWTATTGTATSSTTAYSGTNSMLLGNNWNPRAISKPIAASAPCANGRELPYTKKQDTI